MSDELAIANLYARYAELLNLARFDEVGALFTHGRVTIEGNPDTYEGAERIAAMYTESVAVPERVPDTLLFTTNLQITVDGDRASGKAYFLALHQAAGALEPVVGGRYHDTFVRIDGAWWFEHRHMYTDLVGDLSTHMNRPIEEYLPGAAAE